MMLGAPAGNGRDLRHLPIALSDAPSGVQLTMRRADGTSIDVSHDHVPVSMRPLVLGIRLEGEPPDRLALEVHHELSTGAPIAAIALRSAGAPAIPLARGALHLFRTVGVRNRTASLPTRWLRYALAWRHARLAGRRGDGLRMTAADLRCLNAYYIHARPVYLVAVAHGGRNNVFPMDLVGPLSSGEFLLALRATSPAIALLEGSRRVALSGAPGHQRAAVYALGAHHRKETVDVGALPFAFAPSPCFALPSIGGGLVREIEIGDVHRHGSHVLFVGRVANEAGATPRQLAHVSAMYAEWAARRGMGFTWV